MMLPGFGPAEVEADGAAGDNWYTPEWLLSWLPPIALDPCWSAASSVHATTTIDVRRGEDGLRQDWHARGEGIIWCNPPFSNTAEWLRKCRIESHRLQRVCVTLAPALPGDGPWHSQVWNGAVVVGWIAGRVAFFNPDGRTDSKGRGHGLIIYGPQSAALDVCQHIDIAAEHHAQRPVWVRRWTP